MLCTYFNCRNKGGQTALFIGLISTTFLFLIMFRLYVFRVRSLRRSALKWTSCKNHILAATNHHGLVGKNSDKIQNKKMHIKYLSFFYKRTFPKKIDDFLHFKEIV